jgi:hypothetical protein
MDGRVFSLSLAKISLSFFTLQPYFTLNHLSSKALNQFRRLSHTDKSFKISIFREQISQMRRREAAGDRAHS